MNYTWCTIIYVNTIITWLVVQLIIIKTSNLPGFRWMLISVSNSESKRRKTLVQIKYYIFSFIKILLYFYFYKNVQSSMLLFTQQVCKWGKNNIDLKTNPTIKTKNIVIFYSFFKSLTIKYISRYFNENKLKKIENTTSLLNGKCICLNFQKQ